VLRSSVVRTCTRSTTMSPLLTATTRIESNNNKKQKQQQKTFRYIVFLSSAAWRSTTLCTATCIEAHNIVFFFFSLMEISTCMCPTTSNALSHSLSQEPPFLVSREKKSKWGQKRLQDGHERTEQFYTVARVNRRGLIGSTAMQSSGDTGVQLYCTGPPKAPYDSVEQAQSRVFSLLRLLK
jgi:hypothetical protein